MLKSRKSVHTEFFILEARSPDQEHRPDLGLLTAAAKTWTEPCNTVIKII